MTVAAPAAPAIVIKSRVEARATAHRAYRAQRGFLTNRSIVALLLFGAVVLAIQPVLAAFALGMLVADFIVFIGRRRRYLKRCFAGRPRLVTLADFAEATASFEAAGVPEPNMSDYEVAAGITGRPWANDLRYAFPISRYRGGVVADIGCGDGRLLWRYGICAAEHYIGVDPCRDLVRTLADRTGGRARGVVGTAEATTLPDASVDLVVCSECFEHLEDPGAALREFARILRPGGEIVIQSPSAYQMRNLNPLHVLTTWLARLAPALLQRTVIHENTFLHAFTYHWDFTWQDFEKYRRGLPLQIVLRHTATYRFNPAGSRLHRLGYRISRWPIINGLWWDMTIVLRRIT